MKCENKCRDGVTQLTDEEAVSFSTGDKLTTMSDIEKFEFQIRQKRLAMDFEEFKRVTDVALGRAVWTHEFADPDSLWAEYNGEFVADVDPFSTLNRVLA